MLIPTAEPFYFPGGPTGCLLVHGFTGTPKEMRWMGEYLARQGYSALGVRLFAHATSIEDILRARWEDWFASLEDGWHLLNGVAKQIWVIGLSAGAVLSLLAAARLPVMGVIAMSPLYELPADPRLRFIKLFSYLQPYVKKGSPDWHDLEAAQNHVSYDRYPSKGFGELNELISQMRTALPKIEVPVLLIHSRQDRSVPLENTQKIYNRLGSNEKRILLLENSGHVITREPEREHVFQAAAEFIEQHRENYR